MRYRVRYLHRSTGQVARFYPMSREDAVEVARQLIFDGERDVQIEDETGQPSVNPRSGRLLGGDPTSAAGPERS